MELPTLTNLVAAAERFMPALLDAAVRGAVILALAGVATLAMRRASAAARHGVWLLAFAGMLLLPLVSAAGPGWRILPRFGAQQAATPGTEFILTPPPQAGVLGEPVHATDASASRVEGDAAILGSADATPGGASVSAPKATDLHTTIASEAKPASNPTPRGVSAEAAQLAASVTPLSWQFWFAALWLIGMLAVLAREALGFLSLFSLRRRSTCLNQGDWPALLDDACRQLSIHRPVMLLSSPQRTMPMIWGFVRACILLPDRAAEWPVEQRRAVLLHELGHVRRRDCVTQLIAQLACAAYWFNPLVWVAWRRMQVERERACDDLVLSTGARASSYAQHLLHIASALPAMRFVGAAVAMARPSTLEERLRAILDLSRNRRAVSARSAGVALLAFIAVLLPIAAIQAQNAAPVATQTEATLTVKLMGTVSDDRRALAVFQKSDGTTSMLAVGESLADKEGPVVVTGIEADRVVVTYAGATRELQFTRPGAVATRTADPADHSPADGTTCAFDATIYEVRIPADKIDMLDVPALTKAAADAAGFEKALAELGTAVPLARASQSVRLAGDFVQVASSVPYVTNSQVNNTGQRINSVSYASVGAIFDIAAKPVGDRFAVSMSVQVAGLTASMTKIATDVTAPNFRIAQMMYGGTLEPERPFLVVSVDGGARDDKGMAVAYIARVKFGQPQRDPKPAAVEGSPILQVAVTGNHRLEAKALLEKVEARAGGRYSRELVDADLKALAALHQFVIVRADVEPLAGERGNPSPGVKITYKVEERAEVKSIEFLGNVVLSAAQLRETLEFKEGEAIDPFRIAVGRSALLDLYHNKEYLQASITLDDAVLSQRGIVRYVILEGAKAAPPTPPMPKDLP